jgi:hypothetical protein
MNTAQVSIELVLAGILALCAFVLPFWRGTDISQDLLQTDALIGVLGIAYLFGVVFDKLADTILSPMEDYLRLRQADKMLKGAKSSVKDAFPQNKLEFHLRTAKDGRLDWMNSLKSRIRTSREVAVLGLPASLGIAVYAGFTKGCATSVSQACSAQWIYIFVIFNLLLMAAAAWRESKAPEEDSTVPNTRIIKTHDLNLDPKLRTEQMQQAEQKMRADSAVYYLMGVNSIIAIAIVVALKPENSWIALFGAGGLIISLLSLWTCLRITRTYMKFVARESPERPERESK